MYVAKKVILPSLIWLIYSISAQNDYMCIVLLTRAAPRAVTAAYQVYP